MAHNKILGANAHSLLALILVALYAILGYRFGTPDPTLNQTFIASLQNFGTDNKTRIILALILIDVITGIMCALKLRVFDMQRLATFYGSSVLPYVFGYFLVWLLVLVGLDGILDTQARHVIVAIGFAMIATTLTGSIVDNGQRMNTHLSYTERLADVGEAPRNPQG